MLTRPHLRTIASISLGALLGLGLGAWIGNATILHQEQEETGLMAAAFIQRSDAIDEEAVSALRDIQQSDLPVCSERDLARLRNLVVASHFLKVASRLRDRELLCSSTLGVIDPPVKVAKPDFTTENGRRIAMNAELYSIPGSRVLIIEEGTASVVINRDAYASVVDPRLDYMVAADYHGKRTVFISSGVPETALAAQPFNADQPFKVQGRQYEVRCSSQHAGCIAATLREREVIENSPVFIGFSLLGLLAGLGGGLAVSSALARMNSLGRKLRLALRQGDLEVVYQPIVRLSDRKRVGAEALLRWRDAQGKYISPDVFIAIAEQEGFISEVTRFVLRRVLTQLGENLRQHPEFRVTVNMSVRDLLDNTFPQFVAQLMKAERLPASNIGFEITERSTAEHGAIGRGIQHLRNAGHCIYIDDFGADYSSLSYLTQLHVDAIKLDRSFTRALHAEVAGDSIAPQVVAMAKSLGLILVVEGVETDEQADFYLALDPQALSQGWLFSRALSTEQLFELTNSRPCA